MQCHYVFKLCFMVEAAKQACPCGRYQGHCSTGSGGVRPVGCQQNSLAGVRNARLVAALFGTISKHRCIHWRFKYKKSHQAPCAAKRTGSKMYTMNCLPWMLLITIRFRMH
eukprot:6204397-Pleurochrysis_carterae.AAC.2